MTADWTPIAYRDFHDVPRIFLIRNAGVCLLFDCPFDEAADEYPSYYRVYALAECPDDLQSSSWAGLPDAGINLGEIAVADVVFDETRRRAVDLRIVSRFVG